MSVLKTSSKSQQVYTTSHAPNTTRTSPAGAGGAPREVQYHLERFAMVSGSQIYDNPPNPGCIGISVNSRYLVQITKIEIVSQVQSAPA